MYTSFIPKLTSKLLAQLNPIFVFHVVEKQKIKKMNQPHKKYIIVGVQVVLYF